MVLLISVDPRVDISFVHRTISKSITNRSMEMHLQKILIQPMKQVFMPASLFVLLLAWRFDAYGDIYKFPWLKYLVDAPSYGKDFLAQLTYTPNRQVEIYTRFRNETKQSNQPDNTTVTNYLVNLPRQNWRTQISYKINTAIALRNRVEILWYDKNGKAYQKMDFLLFLILFINHC